MSHHKMSAGSIVLPQALAVTGGGSIDKCGRLSQPSWLLVHTRIKSYLCTYLHGISQQTVTTQLTGKKLVIKTCYTLSNVKVELMELHNFKQPSQCLPAVHIQHLESRSYIQEVFQ